MLARSAIAFFVIMSCGLLALAPAAATAQDAGPRDLASVTTSLEREIEKILDETEIPSISIALIRDGQVVWANAYGFANVGARVPATADTYYSTGSTFKFVTATAVMHLVESGELTLETTLNEIVGPALAVEDADDVTVRHLLSHYSGLNAFEFARRIKTEGLPVTMVPLWSRQASITPQQLLSNTRRTGPPGVEFQYCNDCYGILGYIIEKVSGQSYDEYVAKHVLQPLGVDIDRPSLPSPGVVEHMALPYVLADDAAEPISQVRYDAFPAGDIYLKASDMARFVAAQLNGGEYEGERILSSASTEEMRRRQFDGRRYGLGVGMARFGDHDIIHHSGSIPGFSSRMVADPSTRQGVYIMANCPTSVLGQLASHAMQLMWGDDVEPLPSFAAKIEVTVSPDIFDEYVGKYALTPAVTITVSRVGDRFFVRPTGQTRREVFASSETDFFMQRAEASFTFGRDEQGGPVTHLILHKANDDLRADRAPEAGGS